MWYVLTSGHREQEALDSFNANGGHQLGQQNWTEDNEKDNYFKPRPQDRSHYEDHDNIQRCLELRYFSSRSSQRE